MKEPPFSVKESGYAGFIFPIEIYVKNKDEPKKIKFTYDFTLQQSGILKDRYVFQNPNEDFRKKLLRGGGILVSNNAFYTNPDQESRSRDSFTEEKQQLLSKPKLSSENVKKHKTKEHKEEVPPRTSSFENLFGPPIQKPPKVSPDPKKIDKNILVKSEKKDRERSNSEKKSKHDSEETKDKIKSKEEKERNKEKIKNYNKEQEKSKEKASKRPSERTLSPVPNKKPRDSPVRRPPSPPPRSSSASSMRDEYKIQKHNQEPERKPKIEEKPPEPKPEKEVKEKKKKEKKSHDRDKERKEKKEHKKESHKVKESPVNKEIQKETPKEIQKSRETPKQEREIVKDITPVKEKQIKPEKVVNKFSIENLQKTPPQDNEDRTSQHKSKEKSDPERKHKHKKKDKKRDESKEKHKESSKEKKHKHDKVRDNVPVEKPEVIELRETPVPKERPIPEPASPISIDTASQCSSKSGLNKISHNNDDVNSSHSDSESSIIPEEEEKPKDPSPEPTKHEPSPEPDPEPELEPEPEVEPEVEPVENPTPQPKEKSKKHKDKSSKREEKRRKRKAAEEEDSDNRKVIKTSETAYNEPERGESSGSVTTETKVQDNGVSSSLGEDAEPGDLSPDYMVQLRDLQQRIMKIKNNEDLERVVNLIAETGRYEVTTQTFDFDLCLLDRATVQQLIQLVGC